MPHDPLTTLCMALGLGMGAYLLAGRLRMPPIVPLLLCGMLAGPSVLGIVHPEALGEAHLKALVLGAVLIVLFEGSLSLRVQTFASHGGPITRLLTLGALVTWIGATLSAHFVLGLAWPTSVLIGGVLIVTGPTVVTPLLHTIRPTADLREILRWEAILIDPVGAIAAIVTFEFLEAGAAGSLSVAAGHYLTRTAVGIGFGVVAALLIDRGLRARHLVSRELVTPFALAAVLLCAAAAEILAHESSLFTAPVAGVLVATLRPPRLGEIERFNGELTTGLLAVLFVVLAAGVEPSSILALGWRGLGFLAALQLVRVACVLVSTGGTTIPWRERAFLCWLSPRGIVAASVASVFGAAFAASGVPDAEAIVPVIFLVIVGTVIVQGLLARPIGAWLGVLAPPQRNVIIAGASTFAVKLAQALHEAEVDTVVIDRNSTKVNEMEDLGLVAYQGDVLSPATYADIDLEATGAYLAATPNDEVNGLASHLASDIIGGESVLQLPSGTHAIATADASAAFAYPLAFGERFTLSSLDRALGAGAQIVVRHLDAPNKAGAVRADTGTDFRPLIIVPSRTSRPAFVREHNMRLPAGRVIGIEGLPADMLADDGPSSDQSGRVAALPPL